MSQSSLPQAVDVLVAGGGGAALAAALAAARRGARVLLVEKQPRLGGTTALSVGSITSTGTEHQRRAGITDDPAAHSEDLVVFSGPLEARNNTDLRQLLVEETPATMKFLTDLGLTFAGPYPEPPHKKPRMHVVLPSSKAYIYFLEKACRKAGVDIRLSTRIVRLIEEGGRVAGAVVADARGEHRVMAAGGVILATGDWSASPEYKAKYLPRAAEMDAINPNNVGDGYTVATDLGAQVLNTDLAHDGQIRFRPPDDQKSLIAMIPPWPIFARTIGWALRTLPRWALRPIVLPFLATYLQPDKSLFANGAILVNKRGERFTDELGAPGYDMPTQPDKAAYLIFDGRIGRMYEGPPNFISTAPGIAYAYLGDYARFRTDVYRKAATPEELANKIGVPAGVLRSTLETRAAELQKGGLPDSVKPLREGPYYALGPLYSWVVTANAGLALNRQMEVCRPDGTPIHGLFAAGHVGFGGMVLPGHGHNLGWAFTSGRMAGAIAAARAGR